MNDLRSAKSLSGLPQSKNWQHIGASKNKTSTDTSLMQTHK